MISKDGMFILKKAEFGVVLKKKDIEPSDSTSVVMHFSNIKELRRLRRFLDLFFTKLYFNHTVNKVLKGNKKGEKKDEKMEIV